MRTTTWLTLTALLAATPVLAQAPTPAGKPAAPSESPEQATIRKLNAYVGLLNRTLRAQESLARYQSWVNMKTGPTGRERIIYGLYGLYDVRGEITKAEAAMSQPPAMPELDGAMKDYIAAYQALELRDYGRVDMRLQPDGRVHVIEVNPNPWLSSRAEFAMAARKSGRTYPQLVEEIIELATTRG